MLIDIEQYKKAAEAIKSLTVDHSSLKKVMERLEDHMIRGLRHKESVDTDLKMYITYVKSLPTRAEMGKFLALDLGGTNFRVLLIDLDDRSTPIQCKTFPVPGMIMLGSGQQLFDHIAVCIHSFLAIRGLEKESLPLGFTFSFPCQQEGLAKSKLVNWTKGFKCSNVEGMDVVELLNQAIAKQDMSIQCVAVINDTVGTMMSCAHTHDDCQVGIILGTGTNACYIEDIQRVKHWDSNIEQAERMVINTEWGAFGDRGDLVFILTKYDTQVDQLSQNPGKQIFEKLISGMYLGEIVRQVVLDLALQKVLFQGQISTKLLTPFSFLTKYISEVESGASGLDYNSTLQVLEEMEITDLTMMDCIIVKEICEAVSRRAAHLASAGVAVLLRRVNIPKATVGIDGSLYRFHPKFHDLMVSKISELCPNNEFHLKLSNDGSGIGAALVAAVATRPPPKKVVPA